MLQYSFKIAFLFGPYFPLSFNHTFPMHVELCSSEVPKGTLNMFTTPFKVDILHSLNSCFFKKNKQTESPVTLAKHSTGSSDVMADGNGSSFVYTKDKLGVS